MTNIKLQKEQEQLVTQLRGMFQSSLDSPVWKAWREEAVKCFNYRDGDQWTAGEIKDLTDRGQAPTVNNQIKVFLDYLLGMTLKTKTNTRFRGRNVPENSDQGHLLSELYLYTNQLNKFKYQENDRNEDAACSGFGVQKMLPTYNSQLQQPDIKVSNPDCLNIYPDPYANEYDWSDATFVAEAPWMDLKELQALYPRHKTQLEGMYNNYTDQSDPSVDVAKGNVYIDPNSKRIRPVEIWWVEPKTKLTILRQNAPSIDVSKLSTSKIKQLIKQTYGCLTRETTKEIHMAVFVDFLLLEHRKNPFKIDSLPYVPQFARKKKDGQPLSFVSLIIPLQDAINKRESKALYNLSNNQAIYEDGAVANPEEEARNRQRPDGAIVLNRGALKEKQYQIIKNTDLAITQMNFHNQNLADIRRVSGINPDALGEKSSVRSGVGIAKKQNASQTVIIKFLENITRTKENLARLWLKYVQVFFSSQMTFYITGDINNGFKSTSRTINIPNYQNGTVSNNITTGDYDVVIEEMKNTSAMHQANVELLAQVIPQIAALGPGWGKILISFMDLPGKEQILEQFDALTQPRPEMPKITLNIKWEAASAQDKEFFRELMGNKQVNQPNINAGMMQLLQSTNETIQ